MTIMRWIEENCPDERPAFRGPAAEEDLRTVERATGRPLPADQLAWWRLSDGTEDRGPSPLLIPVVWTPTSVAYALQRHRLLTDQLSRYFPDLLELDNQPAGTAADIPWLPSWLPVAHDIGGSHLFLDLRDGPEHGCVGKMHKEEICFVAPVWWSVTDMLAEVADALVNGTDIDGWHAEVEDGSLHWRFA